MPVERLHDVTDPETGPGQSATWDALIRDLCGFRTGVVADGNENLFDRIDRELALERFRYPSGQSYNGWQIPDNWRVLRGKLFKDGVEVFDGSDHPLGVAFYSKSFRGDMDWAGLQPHLVTHPDLPDAYRFHCAWQYRPWDADWAFCIPHRIYRELGPGRYHVDLDTRCEPGEMIVAHHLQAGRNAKTIVFNAHTCHPHMANDGFAGIAILIRLFQWLGAQDTHYSYRLVLGPEHLGTVFYLRDRPRHDVDRLVSGVFEEMPGTNGPVKATATFRGDQMIDHAFANVLRHHAHAHRIVAWRRGAGNDETVWEAPGYEVPFVEVTRCEDQWNPYREYHSSLDTPELMNPDRLDEMLLILKKVVHILENNVTIQRRFDGLICLSNPQYDLYMERPDPSVTKEMEQDAEKWGHLLDCLFRYMDGDVTVLDIAQRHDLPFDRLRGYLGRFEEKGLVTLKRAEIPRVRPQRVAG